SERSKNARSNAVLCSIIAERRFDFVARVCLRACGSRPLQYLQRPSLSLAMRTTRTPPPTVKTMAYVPNSYLSFCLSWRDRHKRCCVDEIVTSAACMCREFQPAPTTRTLRLTSRQRVNRRNERAAHHFAT